MVKKLRLAVQIFFSFIFVIQSITAFSQTDSAHWDYISKFSQAAIDEMHYSRIPASITMAQALHESRYGTSELAVKANNHFGIKCQTEWTGKRYTYQDDDNNTCFRQYDSVGQSYRDHSNFLMTRPRYAFLFDIAPGDYAAWAHGLKKAGYATNPKYAFILIKLIEDYRLFLLDTIQPMMRPLISLADKALPNQRPDVAVREAARFQKNRIDYYVAQPGDNVKNVTEKLDLLNWQIRKYNEIAKNEDLVPGQVIYLQPKRRHAETGYSFHTVARGETMYSISQLYGIKMHWLYKRNRMKKGEEPKVGQEIWLRGMKGR